MTAPWNRSRPIYKGLSLDAGASRHLLALQGEGALALLDQAATLSSVILQRCALLYVPDITANLSAALAALPVSNFWVTPTVATLLPRLRTELAVAHMSTRLYAAGTESFIGQVVQLAQDFGIDHASIPTEHRGSLARRVQCVHCKGMTDDVRISPVVCAHCGLSLLVRDHYSRRLGAFQGVCIDAEEPGTAPSPEVLFP